MPGGAGVLALGGADEERRGAVDGADHRLQQSAFLELVSRDLADGRRGPGAGSGWIVGGRS